MKKGKVDQIFIAVDSLTILDEQERRKAE